MKAYTSDNKPLTIDEWDNQATSTAMRNLSGASVSSQADDVTKNIAVKSMPVYADEIPPFDITISFVNEYGQKARLVLYGVEILNEGSAFGIDQITSEKACTFVARKVDYMKAVTGESTKVKSNASDNGTATA